MEKFNPRNWPASDRQWVYRLGLAGIALLVGYNVIGPEHAPLWVDVLANLLGVSGATAAAGTANSVLKEQRRDGIVS